MSAHISSNHGETTEPAVDGVVSPVQENSEATRSPPDSESHAEVLAPNDPANEASEPSANEATGSGEQVEDSEEEKAGDEEDDEMVLPPVDEDQLAMLVDFGFPEVSQAYNDNISTLSPCLAI